MACATMLPSPLNAQRGAAGDAAVAAYTRVMASAFDIPVAEASLLLEEGIQAQELPVVLLMARESGLSPAVILSRRNRGGQPRAWIQVAGEVNLDAGAFHVEIPEAELDDRGRQATEGFRSTPRAGWSTLSLSDEQIIVLTNVRVLARELDVARGDVLAARERAGSWPGSLQFLFGVP